MVKNVKWRLGCRKWEKRRRAPLAAAVQNAAGVGLVQREYTRLLTSASTGLSVPCVLPLPNVENPSRRWSNEGSLVRFCPASVPLAAGGRGGGSAEWRVRSAEFKNVGFGCAKGPKRSP